MKENIADSNAATKQYFYEKTGISTEIEPLEPIGGEAKSHPGISNNSIYATKLLIYEIPIGDASTSTIRGERLVSKEVSITKLMEFF